MSGIGKRELQRVTETLSTRDWAILRFLAAQKFATTTQLRRIHFTDHTTESAATRACIRVLDRLLTHRLVGRLERRIGGNRHGSTGFIWHLDVAGERLTRTPGSARRRIGDPSITFVDHTLAVTDTVVTLHELTTGSDLDLTTLHVETAAWRTFLTRHGTTAILKPDLFVQLSSPDYDDYWYIEIDRGTEHLPVLLQKCRTYAAYKATGRATAEHGVVPRVLWIVPTQRRMDRLAAAIHTEAGLPDRLFAVITPEQLNATLRDDQDPETPTTRERRNP